MAEGTFNALQEIARRTRETIETAVENTVDKTTDVAKKAERRTIIKELMIRHPQMLVSEVERRADEIIDVLYR